jgi:hypothetical protein
MQPPPPTQPAAPACNCSANVYNCDDPQAETCFDYCNSIGAGDIHRLDGNNNGEACED